MAGHKTVKEPPKRPDSELTGFVRNNFFIILINIFFIGMALILAVMTIMFFHDRSEKVVKPSPSLAVLPEESAQSIETGTPTDLIVPIRSGAEQLVGQSELETLGSLLSPHGWSVRQESNGNLILIPDIAVPDTDAGVKPLPMEADLTSLRALLEPHGWRIQVDTEGGGVLLIPTSNP